MPSECLMKAGTRRSERSANREVNATYVLSGSTGRTVVQGCGGGNIGASRRVERLRGDRSLAVYAYAPTHRIDHRRRPSQRARHGSLVARPGAVAASPAPPFDSQVHAAVSSSSRHAAMDTTDQGFLDEPQREHAAYLRRIMAANADFA